MIVTKNQHHRIPIIGKNHIGRYHDKTCTPWDIALGSNDFSAGLNTGIRITSKCDITVQYDGQKLQYRTSEHAERLERLYQTKIVTKNIIKCY